MRSWFPLYAGVASLVLSLACAPAPTALSEAHAAAIRDSVTQAQTRFRELSARAHWDSLGAFYSTAPGFRFAESGAVQYRSATEVRRALSRMPAGTRIETSYRDSEIDAVAPGVAVLTTLFETSFVDTTGARFSFGGAVTLLWVHESAGWRIRAGHSSAPVPRPG
ncbi:MAG TPA: nuclear transport factor 2 family protein [Gemmatimonadales bacterium]